MRGPDHCKALHILLIMKFQYQKNTSQCDLQSIRKFLNHHWIDGLAFRSVYFGPLETVNYLVAQFRHKVSGWFSRVLKQEEKPRVFILIIVWTSLNNTIHYGHDLPSVVKWLSANSRHVFDTYKSTSQAVDSVSSKLIWLTGWTITSSVKNICWYSILLAVKNYSKYQRNKMKQTTRFVTHPMEWNKYLYGKNNKTYAVLQCCFPLKTHIRCCDWRSGLI